MHCRIVVVVVALAVAACGSGADRADPAPTSPATTSPATTMPATTMPGTTLPAGTEPTGTEPTGTEPTGTEPTGTEPTGTEPTGLGVVPDGFATVAAQVVPPGDEPPCDVCLWLADTDGLRRRGLMGVTDLGGLDGMAFVYAEPRTTSFTMRNTLMPLSIVFYDAEGAYLDAFDMVPCEAEPCPSYPTPADFAVAIEVPRGGLEALGMTPGSRLAVTGDCA